VDLGVAVRPEPDQLGSVPHQLPQFAGRRRRDPRLRQPAHPQRFGQVGGVPNIVLDPPILKRLHAQRMRQMHPGTHLLQRIDGPIPAVGRLQHYLGILTGPSHHAGEPVDVIEDLNRLQHLTGLRSPDDHTPTAMQIDTDELPP
jgi:hypothetical protein